MTPSLLPLLFLVVVLLALEVVANAAAPRFPHCTDGLVLASGELCELGKTPEETVANRRLERAEYGARSATPSGDSTRPFPACREGVVLPPGELCEVQAPTASTVVHKRSLEGEEGHAFPSPDTNRRDSRCRDDQFPAPGCWREIRTSAPTETANRRPESTGRGVASSDSTLDVNSRYPLCSKNLVLQPGEFCENRAAAPAELEEERLQDHEVKRRHLQIGNMPLYKFERPFDREMSQLILNLVRHDFGTIWSRETSATSHRRILVDPAHLIEHVQGLRDEWLTPPRPVLQQVHNTLRIARPGEAYVPPTNLITDEEDARLQQLGGTGDNGYMNYVKLRGAVYAARAEYMDHFISLHMKEADKVLGGAAALPGAVGSHKGKDGKLVPFGTLERTKQHQADDLAAAAKAEKAKAEKESAAKEKRSRKRASTQESSEEPVWDPGQEFKLSIITRRYWPERRAKPGQPGKPGNLHPRVQNDFSNGGTESIVSDVTFQLEGTVTDFRHEIGLEGSRAYNGPGGITHYKVRQDADYAVEQYSMYTIRYDALKARRNMPTLDRAMSLSLAHVITWRDTVELRDP